MCFMCKNELFSIKYKNGNVFFASLILAVIAWMHFEYYPNNTYITKLMIILSFIVFILIYAQHVVHLKQRENDNYEVNSTNYEKLKHLSLITIDKGRPLNYLYDILRHPLFTPSS